MAHHCQTSHEHPYPWGHVALGLFQRYPNPYSTHVLSEDTIHREVRSNGRVLYSKKFLTKTNKLPKWGEKFFTSFKKFVPLVEESFVDRERQVIVTYTRNVGLSRFMSAVERVEYRPHPDRPGEATVAVKEAWFDSRLYGLRSAVKSFAADRFRNNCERASQGFNHVLERLYTQQAYLSELRAKKWIAMKERGGVLRERTLMVAETAKAHSVLHAEASEEAKAAAANKKSED